MSLLMEKRARYCSCADEGGNGGRIRADRSLDTSSILRLRGYTKDVVRENKVYCLTSRSTWCNYKRLLSSISGGPGGSRRSKLHRLRPPLYVPSSPLPTASYAAPLPQGCSLSSRTSRNTSPCIVQHLLSPVLARSRSWLLVLDSYFRTHR